MDLTFPEYGYSPSPELRADHLPREDLAAVSLAFGDAEHRSSQQLEGKGDNGFSA
jgi:hypothetical protein